MRKALLICVAFLMMTPTLEAQWRRGGLGGPGVRFGGYGYRTGWYGGMGFYPLFPIGFGGPVIGHRSTEGKLKVETPIKDAEVLIDGAFAGTVGELKTVRLRPGAYNVAVRAPGRTRYEERVYVAAGKTLKIRPELRVN